MKSMIGKFQAFMNGENQIIRRKPRLNLYDLATSMSKGRFNKPYEELSKSELHEILKDISELTTYQ